MMDGFAEELGNFIDQAHRAAEALSNSPDLNPAYARREAEALWHDAVAEARRLAGEKLAELQKRRDVSAERLAKEAAALDAMLEPERVQAALTVAQIQANALGAFEDIARVVRRAIVTHDVHTLTAWQDVGFAVLTKRLPDLRMRPGDLEALKAEVAEALAALEPDTLKKARADHEAATAELEALQDGLSRINERWSRTHGGRGPLDTGETTIVTEHRKDGGLRFVAKGRWP